MESYGNATYRRPLLINEFRRVENGLFKSGPLTEVPPRFGRSIAFQVIDRLGGSWCMSMPRLAEDYSVPSLQKAPLPWSPWVGATPSLNPPGYWRGRQRKSRRGMRGLV